MRKPIAFSVALALSVIGLVAAPSVDTASATSDGVAFSADDLPTWQTDGIVWGMASVQGKVIAGGTFDRILPPAGTVGASRVQGGLVILDAETGNPDGCQFPVSLAGGRATIRSVVASADARTVYVGGNFSSIGGVGVARVAQLDPVSCTVTALRTPAISSFVYGMVATPTTLYVAGEFLAVGGATRNHFAAFDATTGALLPWSPSADGIGRAVAVSPQGDRVAIGGDFADVNGNSTHSIAVVDALTGSTVKSFPNFVPVNSATKSIWSDSTQFYVGNEGTGGGVFDGRFAVSWSTLNQTWRDTCLGATQAVLEYLGTLYVASHAHSCTPMKNDAFQDGKRNFFMAEGTTSPNILGWFPAANDGIGEGIGPRALTVGVGSATGTAFLWSGGEFTKINGKTQQSLTRFGPQDVGAPPVPVVEADPVTSGAIQIRFRSVVDPDDSVLTYRVYRDGSSTPLWTGTATSSWWNRPQITVVDSKVTAGVSYSYRVTASDASNVSSLSPATVAVPVTRGVDYPAAVVRDGASLYWRFNEQGSSSSPGNPGTWVRDRSGASTTGVSGLYQNSVQLGVAGAIVNDSDTAAQFDGSTSYVWSQQQRPSPTTYTVETWIKTSTTRGGKIIGYGSGRPRTDTNATLLSASYDKHVYMDNAGRLNFGVKTTSAQVIRSGSAYNDNAWHHIVASQGAPGMRLFVDGVLVGQNAVTGNENYYGNWHVGGDKISSWPNLPTSPFFAGQIDETAVYPSILSAQQVSEHFSLAQSGITPPIPADTIAPTTPSPLSAAVTDNRAALSWPASFDSVGVSGYRVYRSTAPAFVPSATTTVATVVSPSFEDTPGVGSHYYRVDAIDAAGNPSTPSDPVEARVVASRVMTTISPTEDARVLKSSPTSNFGGDTQLSSVGEASASPSSSYLRFTLPEAPTGTTLTSAVLTVRTSTDPTAGSGNANTVRIVGGDWSQSLVTWNTRPTGAGPTLGSITGATETNTSYPTVLDPTALSALLGTTQSVSIIGTGADNLRLWSSEAPTESYRPTLTLTFSPQ